MEVEAILLKDGRVAYYVKSNVGNASGKRILLGIDDPKAKDVQPDGQTAFRKLVQ